MSNDERRNHKTPQSAGVSSKSGDTPVNSLIAGDSDLFQRYLAAENSSTTRRQMGNTSTAQPRVRDVLFYPLVHYPIHPISTITPVIPIIQPPPAMHGFNPTYPQNNVQHQIRPRSREGTDHAAASSDTSSLRDQNSAQPSTRYANVLLEYTQLNNLVREQQLLLNAHFAEAACQQYLMERQLALENRPRLGNLSTGNERGDAALAAAGRIFRERQEQMRATKTRNFQNQGERPGQQESKEEERTQQSVTAAAYHARDNVVNVAPARSGSKAEHILLKSKVSEAKVMKAGGQKEEAPLLIPVTQRRTGDDVIRMIGPQQNDLKSQGFKLKHRLLKPPSKPAKIPKVVKRNPIAPPPQHHKDFIDAIRPNPLAENIIDHFNKKFNAAKDNAMIYAVSEDKEQLNESRTARQEHYKDQLDTMNARVCMYEKLEELIDKLTDEQAASSQKNGRLATKANVREVTMDLIQIGLNNYQLLEDSMDKIIGDSGSDDDR